jgi:hypothetical protein
MKRLIGAVAFAVIAAPAVASPFEQTELDRVLPELNIVAPEKGRYLAVEDHNVVSPAL